MGKRKHSDDDSDGKEGETKEERRERKRVKKEQKKLKKEKKKKEKEEKILKQEAEEMKMKQEQKRNEYSAMATTTAPAPAVVKLERFYSNLAQDIPPRPEYTKTTSDNHRTQFDMDGILKVATFELDVAFLPRSLHNLKKETTNVLKQMSFSYSPDLQGALYGINRADIVTNEERNGIILNELPHIHHIIRVEGTVFCPKVNQRLVATVNDASQERNIHLLVLERFHVHILAQEMRESGFEYNGMEWCYTRNDDNHGRSMAKGEQMTFICDKFYNSKEGIMCLRGSQLKFTV